MLSTTSHTRRAQRVGASALATALVAVAFGCTGLAQSVFAAPTPTPTPARAAPPGLKPPAVIDPVRDPVTRPKPWEVLGLDPEESEQMRQRLLEAMRTGAMAEGRPASFTSVPPAVLSALSATSVVHVPDGGWDVVSGPQALALAVPLVKVMVATADYAPTARRVVFLGHTLVKSSESAAGRQAAVAQAQRQIDDLAAAPVPANMQHAFAEILGAVDADLMDEESGSGATTARASFTSLVQVFTTLGRAVGIR